MNKRFFFLLTFFPQLLFISTFSQPGGTSTYAFLKTPLAARTASLGGYAFAINDTDVTLVIENPSLLNAGMDHSFSLSYINYLSDINQGFASYAKKFNYVGTVAAGIQYINYGKFTETNIYDEKLGEFSAGEYALNLSFSKKFHPQIVSGGTVRGIYSKLFENSSVGIAADLAATYFSKNNSFAAAVVLKNIGAQVKTYSENIRESLPFEAHFAISKKIKFAPVRFMVTASHLEKWNLMGPDSLYPLLPFSTSLFNGASTGQQGNNDPYQKNFIAADNFARHFVFGVELFPSGKIYLRIGHNIRQSRELKLNDRAGFVGYTFGLGLRLKKFSLSYAFDAYHLAGRSNHITFSMNLAQLKTKKKEGILFEEIKPQ